MNFKAGSICSVSNCTNYSWQKNALSLFRFPTDKELCGQWVSKCGSLKLEEKFKSKGSLYNSHKICSKHFALTDFRNPNLTSQGLRKGAVPSLHIFPIGSVSNPTPVNDPSPHERSHRENTEFTSSKSKHTRTSSSKDKPYDKQSLKCTKINASSSKEALAMHPVVSAAAGSTITTRNISKHPVVLYQKQKIAKNNKQQEPPTSLDKSKTASGRRSELPVNLTTCASLHCTSRHKCNTNPHVKFHPFPIDKVRAKLWAINCDRPDLVDLDPKKLHNDYVLCSLHFERNDFTNNLRLSLNHFAIPTLFNSKHNISEASSSGSFAYFDMSTPVMKVEPSDIINILSQNQNSQGSFNENSMEYVTDGDQNENATFYADGNETPLCSATTRPATTQTQLPWKNKTTVTVDNSTSGLLCRLCASKVFRSQMVHIFDPTSDSKQYLRTINRLLPSCEQVAQNDSLPQWICYDCCGILDYVDQAVQGFLAANKKLKHLFCNLLTTTRGIKKNKAPIKSVMPCMELTKQVHRDSVREELMPIKEEIIDENQDHEDQDDATNEQLENGFGTSLQMEDHKSEKECQVSDDTENVCHNVTKRKIQDTSMQISNHLKSASSAKLIKMEGQSHVHGTEHLKNTNKSLNTKKLSLLNTKEPKETVIRSSHTTILTSKDKKMFLCEICDVLFDSIEAALTHRFKEHSREEFSNQVQT